MKSYSVVSPLITKSKFTCGDKCPLATHFMRIRPEDATSPDNTYILDNGSSVGEFARTLYPFAVTIEHTNAVKQFNDTKNHIATGTRAICEASFLCGDLFCAVDILEVTPEGHVKLTEVKSATKIKDIFYWDLAFQVYVVKKCGYIVDSAHLMYVNRDYVRGDELDAKEYFINTDVSNDVFNLLPAVESSIDEINHVNDNEIHISENCFKPYPCPFFEKICSHCLPENSIFDIRGMHLSTKLKHYNNGITTMEEFLKLKKQNPKYVQQCRIEVTKSDEIEVKSDELNEFLDKIQYPITSLDFETLNEAIPLFTGQKPYEQTVFQFSMHVLRDFGGNLEHYEFLGDSHTDWRISLSHELVKWCPKTGSVLVWKESMEKERIIELAELPGNEDIREQLISIANRIVDLMVPYIERVVYNRAMHGSYSVKYVLPALCPNDENLSYAGLSINNGILASMSFSSMVHNPNMPMFEALTIKRALLTYCSLDTYGPFCILDVMKKLAHKDTPDLFKKIEHRDNSRKSIMIGDKVTTNIGTGYVYGFTPCFVRVRVDNGSYSVIRKAHNLLDISDGLEEFRNNNHTAIDGSFRDVTGREAMNGDFVVTKSIIGQVIGKTKYFLKIKLSDGKIVLRKGNFVIIS